jgi:hypothetical protein
MRHLLIALFSTGCVVVHDNSQPPPCSPPTGMQPDTTPTVLHVTAGSPASVPTGSDGYVISGNGQGGYTLFWIDAVNSPRCYSGTITVTGQIDASQTHAHGNSAPSLVLVENQIAFASVPEGVGDGVDFVSSSEPIYITALVDNAQAPNIFFEEPSIGSAVVASPAAFTSP